MYHVPTIHRFDHNSKCFVPTMGVQSEKGVNSPLQGKLESRFRHKPVEFLAVCPRNETAIPRKRFQRQMDRGGIIPPVQCGESVCIDLGPASIRWLIFILDFEL